MFLALVRFQVSYKVFICLFVLPFLAKSPPLAAVTHLCKPLTCWPGPGHCKCSLKYTGMLSIFSVTKPRFSNTPSG